MRRTIILNTSKTVIRLDPFRPGRFLVSLFAWKQWEHDATVHPSLMKAFAELEERPRVCRRP
jgi:hypothetical protein